MGTNRTGQPRQLLGHARTPPAGTQLAAGTGARAGLNIVSPMIRDAYIIARDISTGSARDEFTSESKFVLKLRLPLAALGGALY